MVRTPGDWTNVKRLAKGKIPMQADEMTREHLLDWNVFFKQLFTKRTTDVEKRSVSWLDISCIRF